MTQISKTCVWNLYFHESKQTCKQTSKQKELHVKVCENNHCKPLKTKLWGFKVLVTKKWANKATSSKKRKEKDHKYC